MASLRTWILVGLFGLLLVIGIFGAAKYWSLFFHDIRVVNELPEYRVSLVNQEKLEEYLRNQGFLGSKGFKKIAVVFTNTVKKPVLVESDADGNPLMSAESGSKDGLLVIWIEPAENAFEGMESDRRGRWLDKFFWGVVNINQRKITQSVAHDIEPMSIELFRIYEK